MPSWIQESRGAESRAAQQFPPVDSQAYYQRQYYSTANNMAFGNRNLYYDKTMGLPTAQEQYEYQLYGAGTNLNWGPIAAPPAPPARDNNMRAYHGHDQVPQHDQRPQQPDAKQEKPVTGGVSQNLDYKMDEMTDYVVENTQKLYTGMLSAYTQAGIDMTRSVMPGSAKPAYRKFVAGILSSTRLPSSTIILGLLYLQRRMPSFPVSEVHKNGEGTLWRLLTISLLLGSKFLDDNTFQNRSWAEVSGIAVVELNRLEKDWLQALNWSLHIDPMTDKGFQSWLASWAEWKNTKNQQHKATLDRLAPLASIDTNVARHHSQAKTYTPSYTPSYTPAYTPYYGYYDSYYGAAAPYEQKPWAGTRSPHDMSPPSAPESGPATPEYLALPNSGLPPNDWYGYEAFYNKRPTMHASYGHPQAASYHATNQGQHTQSLWGHAAGCGCGFCSRDAYMMGHGYGQQTVVG